MNIDEANTEPFYRFHRFHEEFNRNIKVSYGALELLRKTQPEKNANASQLIRLPTGEEPWGTETKWRSISSQASKSQQFLSQMGLVRVMSGFEDFLIGTKAESDRHCDSIGLPTSPFLRGPDHR